MPVKTEVSQGDVDLQEILLRGAEVWNAWRSEHPEITNPNLRQADLRQADLGQADLRRANLGQADLRQANLRQADLCAASLGGANLGQADLRQADLSGADLRQANLCGANLREANLSGANLGQADLSGADLSGADLSMTKLWGATNLTEADLSEADLSEADVEGAIGLGFVATSAIFEIKVFDSSTDPESLDALQQAIANFALACGYTNLEIISERYGSFFQKLRLKLARYITPEIREEGIREGEDFYRRGKEYAKAKLERPGVESTQQIATATAQLLTAIEGCENVILMLGKVIVIKHTGNNGKSQTFVRTVTTEIQNKLEASPFLLDSSEVLMRFLQEETKEKEVIPDLPISHSSQ